MDRDGTKDGFDVALTRAVADAVRVPVVASGGCGTVAHMAEVLTAGAASAASARMTVTAASRRGNERKEESRVSCVMLMLALSEGSPGPAEPLVPRSENFGQTATSLHRAHQH